MITKNSRLQQMFQKGVVPCRGGVWLDCYNQKAVPDLAGTILTGVYYRNMHYVTELTPYEPQRNSHNSSRESLNPAIQ